MSAIPFLLPIWLETLKALGPWLMTPLALVGLMAWGLVRYVQGLKRKLAEAEAEARREREGRTADARTMLLEMYRVTRETEQARASRRELDEKFLPVNEALLALLAGRVETAPGPLLIPSPESR